MVRNWYSLLPYWRHFFSSTINNICSHMSGILIPIMKLSISGLIKFIQCLLTISKILKDNYTLQYNSKSTLGSEQCFVFCTPIFPSLFLFLPSSMGLMRMPLLPCSSVTKTGGLPPEQPFLCPLMLDVRTHLHHNCQRCLILVFSLLLHL